jgi:hypothetical protein
VTGEKSNRATLVVDRAQFEQELRERITAGNSIRRQAGVRIILDMDPLREAAGAWDRANRELLQVRFSTSALEDRYVRDGSGLSSFASPRNIRIFISRKMKILEAILTELMIYAGEPVAKTNDAEGKGTGLVSLTARGSVVFVVHGHDSDVKYQVAEYLERVTGSRPVILHEQPDAGRTIIEKFEAHAGEAGFAVVLLTPDDEGRARGTTALNPRARQNVVLELGYFIGRLGRGRVVALYSEGVELPSDLSGVLYKTLSGNWHTELAKELQAAGVRLDLGRLSK